MKRVLEYILEHEDITSTRLAEMLNVAPASISHILAGRNKPSYDFIVKLVEQFPAYDARWLITGKGEPMGKSGTNQPQRAISDFGGLFATTQQTQPSNRASANLISDKNKPSLDKSPSGHVSERIIICFPDNTFSEYTKR